jgi:hypothetical protein
MSRQFKRRTLAITTVAAMLTTYAAFGAPGVASAATLPGSLFEIDANANLTVDTAGNLDWLDGSGLRDGVIRHSDLASGTGDNSFGQGTHEDSAVPTVVSGSIPPNKSDLKDFGLYVESSGSNAFLNVFWTRVQDPSGTTNMDFEFNQSATTSANGVTPVRTAHDLLLTYDLSNGGTVATISKRFWTGSSWGPETALSATEALGTVNTSAITAGNADGLGALDPRTFGEASVDLIALLGNPTTQGCTTYGSAYLKSRSSDSFSAELKDFIAPIPATISNCSTITIHKTNGEGAALAGAGFTLYKDVAPIGGSRGTGDTVVAAAEQTTNASGITTFTDVHPGDYWAVETKTPAGHDTAPDQHITVASGEHSYSLTFDDPFTARQDLTVSLTAHGSKARDDKWTIAKNVDQTHVNIADGGHATFNYSVTVTPNGSVDGAYALSGSVHVANPNLLDDITAHVTVASNVGGGVDCTVTGGSSVSVPKNGSVDLPYSCTFTGTPAASGTATATVTWDAAAAHTPHGSATNTANVTFVVGSETHQTVTVVDDKTDPAHPVTLGTQNFADGPHTYTYSLTKDGVGGRCTDYTNTASLTETSQSASKTVTVCVGQDLVVTKTAVATNHRTYLWNIAKDVNTTVRHIAAGGTASFTYSVTATPTSTTDDAWSVTGQVTVRNPNAWESITANVTDQVNVGGSGTCALTGGGTVTVAASSSAVLDYSCTFSSQPTNGTNTATATWDATAASTPTGTATGTATVTFATTSKTNETITVVDDMTDPSHPVTLGTATFGDGPKTFTYSVSKQGVAGACNSYTNTATISETGQSASKTVTVCAGSDLTLAATATGSFARDDLWAIAKSVDKTTVTAADGTVVTFGYTVTASPNGFADSGYALSGTVTATNPNSWEAVTADIGVMTDLGGGAACTVTDGVGKSVPAGGSVVLAYSCTFTGVPALTGTVTATAAWDSDAASTPTGMATATAAAALVMGTESNTSVTVVDDKTDPNNPVTLGTANWADGPTVFTYSIDKTAAGTTCTTYTNTAQLVETDQTASQDVAVCGQFTGGGGTITPPTKGGGQLVFTGSNTAMMAQWALAGLATGLLLLLVGRRRRS